MAGGRLLLLEATRESSGGNVSVCRSGGRGSGVLDVVTSSGRAATDSFEIIECTNEGCEPLRGTALHPNAITLMPSSCHGTGSTESICVSGVYPHINGLRQANGISGSCGQSCRYNVGRYVGQHQQHNQNNNSNSDECCCAEVQGPTSQSRMPLTMTVGRAAPGRFVVTSAGG